MCRALPDPLLPLVSVRLLTLLFVSALLVATPTLAEEGMWTYDNPPTKQLEEKYGFTPSQKWLDHLRLSSVRFNNGGSGAFVSPRGLVLTNHHVAAGQLQKLSSPEKDYRSGGFTAKTMEEELKCPDLELNVLVSMEDVTPKVLAAARKEKDEAAALKARQAEIARIEKASLDATGLRSDVVSLYYGGEYWLYRFKKYTDVRIVFAPEADIAYFGGDPDNFTYPRYDLDMTLVRVYENGKPLNTEHYLKWNPAGAKAGDLVFVSGHPGTTSRLKTVAQLESERDLLLPLYLEYLQRRHEVLTKYAARGEEQARQASDMIAGIENSQKAIGGMLRGLENPQVMAVKVDEEKAFRSKVNAKPEWKQEYASAWKDIEKVQQVLRERYEDYWFQRFSRRMLLSTALTVVQYVAEVEKPDGRRLEGFHEAGLESLKFRMFSPAPVYRDLEEVLLADTLKTAQEELGSEHPFVKGVLGGERPEAVAKRVMQETRFVDPEFRKKLVEGGEGAVAKSDDPLIVLARKLDPFARERIKWLEDNVESIETEAGERIGKARFALYGKTAYPDATFTLRFSYGTVKGYPMNGTQAPPMTTMYGLYGRAHEFGHEPPYKLPSCFMEHEKDLDLSTPMNFVSTTDVVGGSSGSPVVNRNGEVVGLIFDGNIESLVGEYVYDIDSNRSVAVHTAAMTVAMRDAYEAGWLVKELTDQAMP